jgi:hypothetical protein
VQHGQYPSIAALDDRQQRPTVESPLPLRAKGGSSQNVTAVLSACPHRCSRAFAAGPCSSLSGILALMVSQNVELVRSINEAWERGDYSSTEWADPEIEFVVADGPEPCSGKGLIGLGQAWGAWLSAWEDVRVWVDEYRDLDDERVLILQRKSGRGKHSGLEIGEMHAKSATTCHIRGGKVTKMILYYERENALADLGLGE